MNIDSAKIASSTLEDITDEDDIRVRHILSVLTVVAVAVFVLAGAVGLFGRETTTTIAADPYTIEVEYPTMTRAGNDIHVLVRITSMQELPPEFDVLLDETYLTIFEDLAVFPEPDSQTSTTPEGLRVTVKTEPGSHSSWLRFTGRASDEWRPRFDGDLRIEVGSADPARLAFHTWRMP